MTGNVGGEKHQQLSVLTQVVIWIVWSLWGISYLLILLHHTRAKHPEEKQNIPEPGPCLISART